MDTTIIVVVAIAVVIALFVLYRGLSRYNDRSWSPPQQLIVGDSIEQQARALVVEGKALQAIKLVREATGMGLKEAKDYVYALAGGSDGLHDLDTSSTSPADIRGDAELSALLARGNTIGAIKRVRELTGMGLKEAKDYVDGLNRR